MRNKERIDLYTKEMQEIIDRYSIDDPEAGHIMADDLMCKVLREEGYEELVDLFVGMGKWYS